MRLIAIVVVGMLFSTAHADPFEVRNPVPHAPPSATAPAVIEDEPGEILDPGYARRRNAVMVTAGGTVLVGASILIGYTMSQRFHAAVARLDAGDDPRRAIDDANRAQDVSRVWGTSLFAAGVVGIGVGAYLYFTAPMKIRRERVVVAPAVDRDGVGVAISGGF